MKKINFEKLNLSPDRILGRDDLKKIRGGGVISPDGTCGPTNNNYTCPQGECCSTAGFCGTGPEYCQQGDMEGGWCAIATHCDLYVRELGQTYTGDCYYQLGGKCYCLVTVNGQNYITDPGTTSTCYNPW